ncbi:MAG: hypothetical protein JSS32_05620 [Verrucomicrobia bacterium]|nr:hypothetical protein [Verrucomicrobiota bacterium]
MKGRFLVNSKEDLTEANIYADKSALILDWLLRIGVEKESFSLREVVKETGVSLGLVQRVFNALILKGLLQAQGLRTAKKFIFNKPKELLESWVSHYSIVKKCRIRTYRSAFSNKAELLKILKQSKLDQSVLLALHSAADAHGYKNTNLNALELYILNPSIRIKLEEVLQLEPQERGYEVLLIEPYYKKWIKQHAEKGLGICPLLLTFLDLYHFPLRGIEQAEFIAQRALEIKRIYKKIKN